jgi:hypothetical protein
MGRIDMETTRMLYELGVVMAILGLFAAAELLTICAEKWLEKMRHHHGKK